MFFVRLRQHAKWMFVLLALFMGLGFVLFGVGAGGVGIGDWFRDQGGSGSSDTPSISDAKDRIERNPDDATAYRDLATAYQVNGETTESIAALERYLTLRAKDSDALRELASLYLVRGSELQEQAQNAQARSDYLAGGGGGPFDRPLMAGDKSAIPTDPILTAVTSETSGAVTQAYQEVQAAYTNATDAFSRLAAVTPDDPTVQITLAQTAQQSGDYATAIDAYTAFLKLAPDDPNVPLVKDQLKQLKQAQSVQSG
jgi:tetratricopeptide (TPR) repeat protein